jgi:hypothetical protein
MGRDTGIRQENWTTKEDRRYNQEKDRRNTTTIVNGRFYSEILQIIKKYT